MKKSILALAVSLALAPVLVLAAPGAGTFVLGNGTISTTGATTNVDVSTIHQAGTAGSSVSLVNWNGFNIGTGETVNMTVSDPAVAQTMTFLNYDPSGAMSQISGTLNASNAAGIARVVVVNPNGVSVGNGAVINTTGGFTAIAGSLAVADNAAVQGGKQINVNLTDGVINIDAGAAVTNQTVSSTTLNLFNDLFFNSPVVRLVADGSGSYRLPVSVGINGGDLFYIDRINSVGQSFDTVTGTITNDDINSFGTNASNMYQFAETGDAFAVNINDLTLKSSMSFSANSANSDYALTNIGSNVVMDDGRLLIYSDTTHFSAPVFINGIYGNGALYVNSNNLTGTIDLESANTFNQAHFKYGSLKTDLLSNGVRVSFGVNALNPSAATAGLVDFNATSGPLTITVNNNWLDIGNGYDVNYDGTGVGFGDINLANMTINASFIDISGMNINLTSAAIDGLSKTNSELGLNAYSNIVLTDTNINHFVYVRSNQTVFNSLSLVNSSIASKYIQFGASPYRMTFDFSMDENSSLQTIGTGSVSVTATDSVTYGANASQGARGNNTTTAAVINNGSQIADLNTTGDGTDGGSIVIAAKTVTINGSIAAGTRDPVVVPPVVTPPVVTPPVVTPPVITPPVVTPTDPVVPVTPTVPTDPVTPVTPTDPVTPTAPVTITFEDQQPAPQINFSNGRSNDVTVAGRDILLPAPASDNHLVTVNDPRDKTDE